MLMTELLLAIEGPGGRRWARFTGASSPFKSPEAARLDFERRHGAVVARQSKNRGVSKSLQSSPLPLSPIFFRFPYYRRKHLQHEDGGLFLRMRAGPGLEGIVSKQRLMLQLLWLATLDQVEEP